MASAIAVSMEKRSLSVETSTMRTVNEPPGIDTSDSGRRASCTRSGLHASPATADSCGLDACCQHVGLLALDDHRVSGSIPSSFHVGRAPKRGHPLAGLGLTTRYRAGSTGAQDP